MKRPRPPWALALASIACSACAETSSDPPPDEPPPPSWLDTPLAELPPHLSDVGLYPALPDTTKVADQAILYTPRWELWASGLSKSRYLVLPEGTAVDPTDREHYAFPIGTLFFKTFSAPSPSPSRPVETRLIRLTPEGWEYAAYLWDETASDASLLELDVATPVDVEIDGASFTHEVPARLDCRKCHESNTSIVIGFDELRLNAPLPGETETQLAALHAAGILSGDLPADPDTIDDPDPITRDVLGYLHGNCAHCHNGGAGPAVSFDMRHDVLIQNTVNKPTESSGSAPGIRVVPGSPAESILFLAFSGETRDPEVKPMPPVGVERRDADAVELLRTWIQSLQ